MRETIANSILFYGSGMVISFSHGKRKKSGTEKIDYIFDLHAYLVVFKFGVVLACGLFVRRMMLIFN